MRNQIIPFFPVPDTQDRDLILGTFAIDEAACCSHSRFEGLASQTGVGQAFVVHGEPAASQALAAVLKDYCDEDPILPKLHESFEV